MIKALHIAGARKAGMAIARAILTILVALSVAVMPLGGASAMVAPVTKVLVEAASSVETAHDCCPDAKAMTDCGSLPGCAVKCFGGLGFAISPALVHQAFTVEETLPVHEAAPIYTSGPPLRPPRS